MIKRKGKERCTGPGRLEGGAWALESGCKEMGERERKWRKKYWGVGGNLWNVGVGIVSDMATPLLGRGEKQPQEGNGCLVPCGSRGELGGTQDSDGRWWKTEWKSP